MIINMKYEFPAGEEILSSDQSRIIEQTRFTYSSLGKTFEEQIKTTCSFKSFEVRRKSRTRIN